MNDTSSVFEPQSTAGIRSFRDLRRFAQEITGFRPNYLPAQGDAFQVQRRSLFKAEEAVDVGAIDLPRGQGRVDETAADEFIIVFDGAVSLTQDSGPVEMLAGNSAVIPRGASFSWRTDGPTTLIYLRHKSKPADATAVVRIDESATLQPSGTPPVELLIGATPACRNYTDYRSADGELTCGTWDSTPYRRKAMLFGHCELMHLLEGAVTLEDEAGNRRTFMKGDILVVEQGARCSWDSFQQVKKVYATFRPAP
ncbi:cupin domain-containing protein [Azohydromonas aeria]|uniref:cupin domain-containing protein n=1 Tax=Azohydromonas aeria TaxID=2590212 RepID=UPI0012FBBE93|nr:cupin domain-containing protein [Azohydromonas aeria]